MENNIYDPMPNVTVGIITYNRPEMLREAVLSIINQTYENFELLIGNDYTETPVTLDTLGIDSDPRVKILNHSHNMGEIRNMNHLLELSQAEWFVWMADDDLFHQSFLELSLNSISPGSQVVAVYSAYTSGSSIKKKFFDDVKRVKSNNLTPSIFISKYTSRELMVIGCYGLMKTKTLKEVGGMPSLGSSFSPYSDTLVPILLSQFGSINYLKAPLCFLRTHAGSLSVSSSDAQEYANSAAEFLTRLTDICRNVNDINMEQCVFNMVGWFRDNDLEVMARNSSISRFRVGWNFIYSQFKNNYCKVSTRYWFRFTIINIKLLTVFFLKSIYRKLF